MVTILLVLMLFLSYPNMYKMRTDLGLTDAEMTALFGDAYIADIQVTDAAPDITSADARLEIEAEQSQTTPTQEEADSTPSNNQ
jgi:hypothetical protein